MLDYDSAIALIERIGGVEALWVNADGEIFKTAGFPID
jgi:hypothetical protein